MSIKDSRDLGPDKRVDFCRLIGVRTHNLKNIDVEIPLGKLTAVTGVSGSGKSSLVFDTLYAESFRRYVESLSSFARQYIKALPKPDLDGVENLPPAIAVKQSRAGSGQNRSTVATLSELAELLRHMYAHRSQAHCIKCSKALIPFTPERVTDQLLLQPEGTPLAICASLKLWSNLRPEALRYQLESQGFGRLYNNGEMQRSHEVTDRQLLESYVVIDRIKTRLDQKRRITESCRLAMKLGGGQVTVVIGGQELVFHRELICCGVTHVKPSENLFSYNHPQGACQTCQGFGRESVLDLQKIVPDRGLSLQSEGIAPWNFGSHKDFYAHANQAAPAIGLAPKKSFAEYSETEWQWLMNGTPGKAKRGQFDGLKGYFTWLDSKKHKMHYRIHSARFKKYVLCSECNGDRLNDFARACYLEGLSFPSVMDLRIAEVTAWLDQVRLAEQQRLLGQQDHHLGISEAVDEALQRLHYLQDVGLAYLQLNRSARTLSGGELQRIHMARCLGSALSETMYCLDEPSAGLHARDSQKLLQVIYQLRNQGNTVVVVEHEKTLIDGADHNIEIGPAAGHLGGELISPANSSHNRPRIDWPQNSWMEPKAWIQVKNARVNNLKGIDVKIPVGRFSVVCGVSGSGKTSLIRHSLYPLLETALSGKQLALEEGDPELCGRLNLEQAARKQISQVVEVSQSAIGRSSRSNIATYLGIYDGIRKLLAKQEASRTLELNASSFSFNTAGGRCEHCKGLGVVSEDLSFLGSMDVICPVCEGRRFSDPVLSVRFRRKSLIEILQMTVAEAYQFFADFEDIAQALHTGISLGLGYIGLGQSTSSFSGGEAQRLKLIKLVYQNRHAQPSCLIFDEPSTGLSDQDVLELVHQLRFLGQKGHTVIVIEHHLGMIQSADYIVEIGPDAAEDGGRVVFEGSAQEFLSTSHTLTSQIIRSSH